MSLFINHKIIHRKNPDKYTENWSKKYEYLIVLLDTLIKLKNQFLSFNSNNHLENVDQHVIYKGNKQIYLTKYNQTQ